MTIEERLEALTQTLELTAHQAQDTERRLNKLAAFVNDIAEGTARLLNIAQIHEQRISKLEGD